MLDAPADAGCPVASSVVTCSGKGSTPRSATVVGNPTSATVGSLDYGDTYNCTVVVSSGAGAATPSPASAAFAVGPNAYTWGEQGLVFHVFARSA